MAFLDVGNHSSSSQVWDWRIFGVCIAGGIWQGMNELGIHSSDSFHTKTIYRFLLSDANSRPNQRIVGVVMDYLAGKFPLTFPHVHQCASSFMSHLVHLHVLQDAIGRLPPQRHMFVSDAAHAAAGLQGSYWEVLTRSVDVATVIAGPEIIEHSWIHTTIVYLWLIYG